MDDLLSIAVSNAVAATVLALMAILVGAVYRRPALVHGLWLLVLLKLVTPPLLFLPVSWPAIAESPPQEIADVREEPTVAPAIAVEEREAVEIVPPAGEEEPAGVEALPAVSETSSHSPAALPQPSLWPRILSIVWGVGALAWFFLALGRLHRFRRLLRFAHPASAALQERTRRLAQALGLKRCPCVHLLPGRVAPMLWAIGGSPRLLVPADLVDLLNDEQLDTLLLHELAHLRRRNHWVRILEFVVMGLYWWHPIVWYARRELREAEEQCCDAWVVSTLPGTGRTYASALLDTLDFLSTAQAAVPPLASGLGQIADLKRRLTMIMRGNTPRSLTWPGCLAVVALGLSFLPMLPALHGQVPGKEDTSKAEVEAAKAGLEMAKAQLEMAKARLEMAKQKNVTQLMRQYNELVKEAKYAEAEVVALKLKELDPDNPTVAAAIAQAKELRRRAVADRVKENKPEGELKAAYRIEITFPTDKLAANPHDMIDKIRKVLLKGSQIVFSGPHQVPASPVRQSDEQRINDLEKKLEKVQQELHDLRKQMKESRSGVEFSPATTRIAPLIRP